MKLHKIIELNEDPKTAILIEKMLPYRKLLLRYYRNVFRCEPVLMVTSVSNAAQYGKIVPAGEFYDALWKWVDWEQSEEDIQFDMEVIAANSRMLSDLIQEGGDSAE